MKLIKLIGIGALCLTLIVPSGCTALKKMTPTGKSALIGGGAGAALGAGVGPLTGGGKATGIGALVGSATAPGTGQVIRHCRDKQAT